MFQSIEGGDSEDLRTFKVTYFRNSTVKKLWSITERFNTLHKGNWTLYIDSVIKEYQNHVVSQALLGYNGLDTPLSQWTFEGALLYSITVNYR